MKLNDLKKELATLAPAELQERLDGLRRELFSLRLNKSTAHVKDYSQFGKLRKGIARIETYIRGAIKSK